MTSLLLPLLLTAAPAQVLGPDAASCDPGGGPAMLVVVNGLKSRAGKVRIRTYGGDPKTYFNNKKFLLRTQIPTPPSGAVRICMPVPAPGYYAIDLRHDANDNGETDRADGGGASGDPRLSLIDMLFGRKPPAAKVRVLVGDGVTTVPVTAMYLKGGSFKPISEH